MLQPDLSTFLLLRHLIVAGFKVWACLWHVDDPAKANLSLSRQRHGSYHGISQTIHHISSYLGVFMDLVTESRLPKALFLAVPRL